MMGKLLPPIQFSEVSMLNSSRRVLLLCAFGSGLAFGLPACAQTAVHPAPPSRVITVTVTESRRGAHGRDRDFVIAQAAGFSNDTCDIITTFDVVKSYEERQNWSNVRQRIDVVIDGKAYPAKFRDLGFYPLGLNLACIDFDAPNLRTQLQLPTLPLDGDSHDPSSFSFDDKEIANSDPGTPFLNAKGEISSVLIATPNGPLEFASADQIRVFLAVAAGMSPWPSLRQRPLMSI
jgi:hypothetical protein